MEKHRSRETAGREPRIAFVGSRCLLDLGSGVAHSIRAILETMAGAGFVAQAFTASIFDGDGEKPFGPILGSRAAAADARGKLLVFSLHGVRHFIFRTASSRPRLMTEHEQMRMVALWKAFLAEQRLDLVVTFGTGRLARQLHAAARTSGARLVFYLGNAEMADKDLLHPGDLAVCPSVYLTHHYRKALGIEASVLYPVIDPQRVARDGIPKIAALPTKRQLGFITFLTPSPEKGLTLFVRLAQRAARERPFMRFLVVEGRTPRAAQLELKIDLSRFSNVWLVPAQHDMASIYSRTSVLLVPSFWREGLGRSVIEAQLSGIPVISSRQGGLTEALGSGGVALAVPQRCIENHFAYPDEEAIAHWWRALVTLWDDAEAYTEATTRARAAAQAFRPNLTRSAIIRFFSEAATPSNAIRPGSAN